ncbi:MAG: hypothetical protein ACXWPM_00090 [Bdellovibrionota bacterium]
MINRNMKVISLSLIALQISGSAWAAGTKTFSENKVKIGDSSAANKTIELNVGAGAANPKMQWNQASSTLQFANDGTNFKDLGSGSGSGQGIQLLSNGDAESGSLPWVNSGAGTYAIESSTPLHGKKSFKWTASGSSDSLTSEQEPVPPILYGQSCSATIYYKGGSSNVSLQVINGSSVVLQTKALTASTGAIPASVYFLCPSSGTIALRLLASASAPLITFDDGFLGSNSLLQVSQASLVAEIQIPTQSCTNPTATAASYNPLTGGNCTEVVTGNIQELTPGTTTWTLPNLPPGEYDFRFNGSLSCNSGPGSTAIFHLTDGTKVGPSATSTISAATVGGSYIVPSSDMLTLHTSYSTAGTHAVSLEAYVSSPGGPCAINVDGLQSASFTVYRYPSQSQVVSQATGQAAMWSGQLSVASPWSTTSGSQSDFTTAPAAGTLTTVNNVNFGTVVQNGTTPGVTFSAIAGHTYAVSISSSLASSSTSQLAYVYLTDGVATYDTEITASNAQVPVIARGQVTASSTGSKSVWLQGSETGGSTASLANSTPGLVYFTIQDITQPGPTLVLPGNVQSGSAGQEIVNRATITNNGSICAVASQSGSWMASATRSSAGKCALVWSGFSSAPSCVVSSLEVVNSGRACLVENTLNSTSATVHCYTAAQAGDSDNDFNILCMGPK